MAKGRKRKLLSNDRFAAINAAARKVNCKSGGSGGGSKGREERRYGRMWNMLVDLQLCSTTVKVDGKEKRREIRSDNPALVINRVWSLLSDGCTPELILKHGGKTLRAERFGFSNPTIRDIIFEDGVEAGIAPKAICHLFGYAPEHAPKGPDSFGAIKQLMAIPGAVKKRASAPKRA